MLTRSCREAHFTYSIRARGCHGIGGVSRITGVAWLLDVQCDPDNDVNTHKVTDGHVVGHEHHQYQAGEELEATEEDVKGFIAAG